MRGMQRERTNFAPRFIGLGFRANMKLLRHERIFQEEIIDVIIYIHGSGYYVIMLLSFLFFPAGERERMREENWLI